jgi:hypothetical protein
LLVSIDALAQRYGLLPTEVLSRASTFDLRVMEVGNRYSNRKQTMSQGGAPPAPNLTQKEMERMLAQVKNEPAVEGAKK